MAKMLRYGRHGKKDGQIIGQEGLNQIADVVANNKHYGDYTFTDIFYGTLYRSAQTALAVVIGLAPFNRELNVQVHTPIEEAGTDELFKEMATPEFKEAVKAGATNLEALDKVHPREKVQEWEKLAAAGVQKMFDAMQDGSNGFFPGGHDPVIALAARHFGYSNVCSMGELEYLDFVQDDDRVIRVITTFAKRLMAGPKLFN